MKMDVIVNVGDALTAMGISGIVPEDDSPTFEVSAEIDDDEIKDAAPKPEPFELHEQLDQATVMDLSAAIRRGDRAEAEMMLDRLLGDDDTVTEWVQQARYSRKARVAQAA